MLHISWEEYDGNQYIDYCLKVKLIEMLKEIEKELMNYEKENY